MTVGELIEMLKQCDKDGIVHIQEYSNEIGSWEQIGEPDMILEGDEITEIFIK